MIRKRFLTQRPRAMAERAAQIGRLQQVRRMLADLETPFLFADDLFGGADDNEYDRLRRLH